MKRNKNHLIKLIVSMGLLMLLVGCNGGGSNSTSFQKTEEPAPAPAPAPVQPAAVPQAGACGIEHNTCLSGTLLDVADTKTEKMWQCLGLNKGSAAYCQQPIPPPDLGDCVQVFYDDDGGLGRESALMLLNLLGHFPQYQQILGPIEQYQAGDIERCQATFYLGTEYDNGLPDAFIEDFKSADMPVVWMGYNFWKLGSTFERDFGFSAHAFDAIDYANLDSDGMPSFFRDVNYKGETFFKYNAWNAGHTEILAPDEMVILRNKTNNDQEIMATAQHSFTGEEVPWAIRSLGRNHQKFYVAEVPFDYTHEADRYLVFADLLFDFLQEEPRHNAKYAVLRLEEIHPLVNRDLLQEAVSFMHDNNIQPTINLIPHFADPFYAIGGHPGEPLVRMEERPAFVSNIERYISEGSVILWNGVTHQYDERINPHTGASGDDYEFWDDEFESPISEDSVGYILNRLDDGFASMKLSGIEPQVWVTPDTKASALDNLMFGQIFTWRLGRGFYFDYTATGFNRIDPTDASLRYIPEEPMATNNIVNRQNHFAGLSVTTTGEPFHQLYPYEIYGDIYATSVIPENLGGVQPFPTDQVQEVRTVQNILDNAKRNLVLRDVWASMYYHPFLLSPVINPPNGVPPKDLQQLITGIKGLGYEFISVDDFASNHTTKAKPWLNIEETH